VSFVYENAFIFWCSICWPSYLVHRLGFPYYQLVFFTHFTISIPCPIPPSGRWTRLLLRRRSAIACTLQCQMCLTLVFSHRLRSSRAVTPESRGCGPPRRVLLNNWPVTRDRCFFCVSTRFCCTSAFFRPLFAGSVREFTHFPAPNFLFRWRTAGSFLRTVAAITGFSAACLSFVWSRVLLPYFYV